MAETTKTADATMAAKNLRALRRFTGASQAEVAEALGCVPSTISRIESGRLEPAADLVLAACRRFLIAPHELLGCDLTERFTRGARDGG